VGGQSQQRVTEATKCPEIHPLLYDTDSETELVDKIEKRGLDRNGFLHQLR
jgi:hypothetical protein